jgi:hypothetical protein
MNNEKSSKKLKDIKEDFTSMINAEKITPLIIKELAKKYQICPENLKLRVEKENWCNVIIFNEQEMKDSLDNNIKNEYDIEDIDIQLRNFIIATLCLDKGLDRLCKIPNEEITFDQSLKLIKMGIKLRLDSAGVITKLKSDLARDEESVRKKLSNKNWKKAGRIIQVSAEIEKFCSDYRKDPKKADAKE